MGEPGMSQPQKFAVVFTEDRPVGSAPDPGQLWPRGALYSLSSQRPRQALPPYLKCVELDAAPDHATHAWDASAEAFVPRST